MANTVDYELVNELTVELTEKDEEKIISCSGIGSLCIVSFKVVDATATATLQTAIDSKEWFVEQSAVTDALWENIKVSGSYVPSLTADILSQVFTCPSLIKIKNTSASDLTVRFSFRLNRGGR
jgi:hypothetical protein